jgi:hypothetical protein
MEIPKHFLPTSDRVALFLSYAYAINQFFHENVRGGGGVNYSPCRKNREENPAEN